ncbi:hypothetical protein BCON_0108g00030 [Botryotinia convoluta]|uniref:Uncharacterized protein n=1 Tax=Botryotinia convoluta TaxID=54673 RepID=A0A4Z1HZ79_9HELO|nr:hypothetical protein BCON_0108g00030 [Botryotinia convoluta]
MANSTEGSKSRHDHGETPIHSAGPLEEDGGSIHTDKKISQVFHGCLCHEYVIQCWNEQAVELSPGDTYEIAVQKHAYNSWFEVTQFKRSRRVKSAHVPSTDIQPSGDRYSCATTEYIYIVKVDGYTFIVAQPLTHSEHRLQIGIANQMSLETKDIRHKLEIHPSENFWNLPKSHRCHILRFPQEILDIIFNYLLWIPRASVDPDVIITNVGRSFMNNEKPSYKAALLDETHPIYNDDPKYEPWRGSAMIKGKKICHGGREIIQLNGILRRAIDVTCLRTCKKFFKFGSEILYRKNIFKFPIESIGPFKKETCWIEGDFYNPDREKPELGQLYDWPQAIPYVMEQTRQGVPLKGIGWLGISRSIPPFSLLHPSKECSRDKEFILLGSSITTQLQFKASRWQMSQLPRNLFPDMCIYIQFINEFCPSVGRVILELDAPTCSEEYDKERLEHTITPFLRNQIRDLKYVKSLALRSWDTSGLKYANGNPDVIHGSQDLDLPIARETIKWFEDRARCWAKEEQ